ncbi:inorganic diphosphatase [Taibaiella helva]|uniref:inorganic diphosphatase n=1 Tax=Taibaiella helva TaxID=2301235 RepID=UPI000E579078|nr:inorganic diphosphatase [Taibaiella helva]
MKQTSGHLVQVVIETIKGSREKYAYDQESGFFKLKKILPAGMVFPYDFGFIPGTKGADGDPLDILVLSELYSFPGCLMPCRLLGAFKAKQGKKKGKMVRNDRYLAVPVASMAYNDIAAVNLLPKEMIRALEDFFIRYNQEEGKRFEPSGYIDAGQAMAQIKASAALVQQ